MSSYRVSVQTGDVRWASTDANVKVQLIGSSGSSERMKLDTSADNFERGNIDRFNLTTVQEIGWIDDVLLTQDGEGVGDGWNVDWVEVIDNDNRIVYKVPFDSWLGDDDVVTKPVVVGPITL